MISVKGMIAAAPSGLIAAMSAQPSNGMEDCYPRQGWQGRTGAQTCAPRPAPQSEICAPRPAPPCAPDLARLTVPGWPALPILPRARPCCLASSDASLEKASDRRTSISLTLYLPWTAALARRTAAMACGPLARSPLPWLSF